MARAGRSMILQHIDRANKQIDNYLLHIMQIDGLFAGCKMTDENGNFLELTIPDIVEGEQYQKQREYLHGLATLAAQLQEMTNDFKGF